MQYLNLLSMCFAWRFALSAPAQLKSHVTCSQTLAGSTAHDGTGDSGSFSCCVPTTCPPGELLILFPLSHWIETVASCPTEIRALLFSNCCHLKKCNILQGRLEFVIRTTSGGQVVKPVLRARTCLSRLDLIGFMVLLQVGVLIISFNVTKSKVRHV